MDESSLALRDTSRVTVVSSKPDVTEASTARSAEAHLRARLTTVLFVLVWLWVVLPRLIQSLTAPKFRGSVGADLQVDTPLSSRVSTLLGFAVFALCLAAVAVVWRSQWQSKAATRPPTPLWPLVVALSPWCFLVMHDLFLGFRPATRVFVYAFVMVATWQLRPGVKSLGVLGYLTGVAALLSIAMGVLLPDKGLFQSAGGGLVTEEKQFIPIGILVGFLTHGNSLGQFVGLGLPLVGAITNPRHRYFFLTVSVVAVVWTASRASLAAGGAILVVMCVFAFVHRERRRVAAWAAIVACYLGVGLLPWLVSDPGAFTNRGLVWMTSLQWFEESPFIGLGSRWYSVIGSTSQRLAATVFHGHNESVQLLVTGGVCLLALVVLLLCAATASACRLAGRGSSVGVLFLIGLGVTSALEIPFVFVDNLGLFPVSVLPLAVLLFTDDARAATGPVLQDPFAAGCSG
jgi:hypothetical protein